MLSQKGQAAKEEKDRKKPERIEAQLGLNFPVTRMQKFLRNEVSGFDRISKKAAAGLTAVIEYINDKIFENALEVGNNQEKKDNFRVKHSYVVKAIQNDETLTDLILDAHFKGTNCGWKLDWLEHWKEQKKESDKIRARRLRKEKKMMDEEEMMSKTKNKNSNKKKNKKKNESEED